MCGRREGAEGAGGRVGHVGRHAVAREQHERPPCNDTGQRVLPCAAPHPNGQRATDGVYWFTVSRFFWGIPATRFIMEFIGSRRTSCLGCCTCRGRRSRGSSITRKPAPSTPWYVRVCVSSSTSSTPSWVCSSAAFSACDGFLSCSFDSSGCPLC
jgi:hypothetical protein